MTETFNRVADFILKLAPGDLPGGTREAAALMFLDTLGVAIGAAPMQAGRIARGTAAALYGSSSPSHSARMLLDGRRVSVAGAAFAAAAATDNLDAHDGYAPSKGHIGVVIIPAIAALAETVRDLSGPEALTLTTIGYEIAGRAGLALHANVSDYHTSGAWNALGVAAVAARMRRLSRAQLREALGIAEYHGPRSQMMREIANPTMLHDGSAWGALAGISAAVLAEGGFTGAPAITVEAPEAAAHWDDLGKFWQVQHQYVKPYPICRWAHAPIDALRGLMRKHRFGPEQIENIHIRTFRESACLYAGLPETTSQAQYSLAFAVAVMGVHGRIGVEHITGAGLHDPQAAALHSRITVSEAPRHSARFPACRVADVEVTLTSGAVLRSGDVHARGGPESPMPRDEITGKFMEFAVPVVGEPRSELIREAVLGFTREGSRFSQLAELLYAAPGG
ncbi:MmgE/PrpD family protein [Cribrihabitans neustonicus]|uniref:MmgE/PrpD family protein n=1 Tax=Cribrihabitans neustonicus TaxID=1429085 RepID=UPI003B5B8CB3